MEKRNKSNRLFSQNLSLLIGDGKQRTLPGVSYRRSSQRFGYCISKKLLVDEFRFLAMAFASFRNDEERKERANRLKSLHNCLPFLLIIIKSRLTKLSKKTSIIRGEMMAKVICSQATGQLTKVSEPKEIAKLNGDPLRENRRSQVLHVS